MSRPACSGCRIALGTTVRRSRSLLALSPPRPRAESWPLAPALRGRTRGRRPLRAVTRRRPLRTAAGAAPLLAAGRRVRSGCAATNEELVWRRVVLGELLARRHRSRRSPSARSASRSLTGPAGAPPRDGRRVRRPLPRHRRARRRGRRALGLQHAPLALRRPRRGTDGSRAVIVAELDESTKRFGRDRRPRRRVASRSATGEVVALLGPNGAGKSTAIAILLGLRRAGRGHRARSSARDPRAAVARRRRRRRRRRRPPSRRRCACGELSSSSARTTRGRVGRRRSVERFELGRLAARQLGGLSGGERRRLGVALAFAGRPAARRPRRAHGRARPRGARSRLGGRPRARARGRRRSCSRRITSRRRTRSPTRVVLLEGGRVVADGAVAELKAAAGLTVVRFRAAARLVIEGAERDGAFVRILTRDGGADGRAARPRRRAARTSSRCAPLTLEEALAGAGAAA